MATQFSKSLFEDGPKICKECHRVLPKSYEEAICPACQENELFLQVKDFIREYDVTEYDVAEHFQLPHFKVKEWIREGRIQYKNLDVPTISAIRCIKCGEPIAFGSFCQSCWNKKELKGSAKPNMGSTDEKFRYL